jgi:hypothetical protein
MSPKKPDIQSLVDDLRSTLGSAVLTPDSPGHAESIVRWSGTIPNNAVLTPADFLRLGGLEGLNCETEKTIVG